ncbi:MAG: hypothetical protein ABI461_24225 [Polyangiaceae bacterium]
MKRTIGLAVGMLFLAACSKDEPIAPKPVAPPVDAAVAIEDAGPTAPRLTLDVSNASPRAWSVTGELLPALSEDGASVVILVQKEDGTRSYPNGTLETRTVADDKVASSTAILDADAIVTAEGAPDAFDTTLPAYKKAAQAKAEEASAILTKGKWTPFVPAIGMAPQGDAGAPIVPDAGYLFALTKVVGGDAGPAGKLMFVVANAPDFDMKLPLLSEDASSFVVAARKPPKPQKGNPMCKFTPYIAETAVNPLRHIVVVRIAQSVAGNVYGCFEPSQWHVYSFGK